MNDHVETLPEPGDQVWLLFATMYAEGLQPNSRGTVAAIDSSGTIWVQWHSGAEQELRVCEKPYRLLTRAFSTESHGGGRLIMRVLDDKSKAAGMPKPGDRIEFCSSSVRSGGLWPGNKGTVDSVDKRGVVCVSWDNGAKVDLVPCWDTYRILSEKDKGEADVGDRQ